MSIENAYDPTHEDAVAAASGSALKFEKTAALAGAALDEAAKAGKLKPSEKSDGMAVFVAPVERNTSVLVNPHERKIISIIDPNSPTGRRSLETEGDVFIEFKDGICLIDTKTEEGQKRLAWAQSHPEVCRDISEPMTAAWVQMKEAQTPTSRREASLPTGLDVDRLLAGDTSAMRSGNATADRARQALDSGLAGA